MFQYPRLDLVKIAKNPKDTRDVSTPKKSQQFPSAAKVEPLDLNSQVQSLWFVYFYSKLLFFYKQVNVTSSRVPDHCIKYALNDPTDSSFRGSCDHTHDLLCERCEELKTVLSDIQAAILNSPFESENEKTMPFTCSKKP